MTELRSKRDVSDTASLMTVDQITASVESRRESLDIDTGADSTDDWTKVGSDEGDTIDESTELSEASYEDDSEEDEDLDEEETHVDDDNDEPGKAVTSKGGVYACVFHSLGVELTRSQEPNGSRALLLVQGRSERCIWEWMLPMVS